MFSLLQTWQTLRLFVNNICFLPAGGSPTVCLKKYRVVSHLQILQGHGPHIKNIRWFTRFKRSLEHLAAFLSETPQPHHPLHLPT